MAIITFDFDDTLTQTQWDEEADCFRCVGPNRVMLQTVRAHLDMGDEVHVIVPRIGPELINIRVDPLVPGAFLREHLGEDLERLAGVHFTSQDLKWRLLHRLDSDKHYDDDPCELDAMPPGCVGVRVPTLHTLD
jgi:hypothetical protein